MKYIPDQPFRTPQGDVITAKALVAIHGTQHLQCYESKDKHDPETLTPMTPEEYEAYLDNE